MSNKIESGSQIPDKEKAWTAAKAEDEFRKLAKEKFGDNPNPLIKEVIEKHADKVGEERIKDYNPDQELELDALRAKAEELILKCEFHLKREFGDLDTARHQFTEETPEQNPHQELIRKGYELLLESIDALRRSIKNINLDKGETIKKMGADFLAPEKQIPELEKNITLALQWIRESKQKTGK